MRKGPLLAASAAAIAVAVWLLARPVAEIDLATEGEGRAASPRSEDVPPATGGPSASLARGASPAGSAAGESPAAERPAVASLESTGPFAGVVVTRTGAPVAGAVVRVVGGGVPEATTGVDGRFAFTTKDVKRELAVLARAKGLAPARSATVVRAGEEARVVMLAARELRVTVVREGSRAGLYGARVLAFTGPSSIPDALRPLGEATARATDEAVTDRAGQVVLRVPGGEAGVVAVGSDGSVAQSLRLLVPTAGLDVVLVAKGTSRLEGTVVAVPDASIVGARLRATGIGLDRATTSGVGGAYAFEGLPADARIRVHAEAEGRPAHAVEAVTGPVGETVTLPISIPAWKRFFGRVVDGGKPVVGAVVTARSLDPRRWTEPTPEDASAAVVTDPDGRFVIERFPPSGEDVVVDAVGPPRKWAFHSGGPAVATGSTSEPVVLEATHLFAHLPGPLEVLARGARGEPLVGAVVEVRSVDEYALLDRGRADDAGVVRLASPGGPVVVVVQPREGPTFQVLAGFRDSVIARAPTGVVSGRVRSVTGAPLPLALRLDRASYRYATGDSLTISGWGRAQADAQGSFRFEGVGDGPYRMAPADPGLVFVGEMRDVSAGDSGVELVVIEIGDEPSLRLEAEWIDSTTDGPLVRPAGTVLLRGLAGAPIRRVSLVRVEDGSTLYRSRESLPPGEYEAQTLVGAYEEPSVERIRITGSGSPTRLRARLAPSQRVEGVVRGVRGRRLPTGDLRVIVGGRSAKVAPDGRYTVAAFETGEVDVRCTGDHVLETTGTANVEEDSVATCDLEVEPAGAIRVQLPAGRLPARGAWISLRRESTAPGEGVHLTNVALDRSWLGKNPPARTAGGLQAGRWHVSGSWDGRAIPETTIEVALEETATVEVTEP